MEGYITIHHQSAFEFEDRKSRFIGEANPVSSEAEALEFIETVKRKYPDANHHVYAYVIKENSIMRFTDDREPQGTAGMPVPDAIRKHGCTNAVIVVTRYFGGTLLGTGGLVHAYSSAALGAIRSAEIIKYDVYAEYEIECSYPDYQKVNPTLASIGFREDDTEFSDKVIIRGRVLMTSQELLIDKLVQLTSGRVKIKKVGEKFDF